MWRWPTCASASFFEKKKKREKGKQDSKCWIIKLYMILHLLDVVNVEAYRRRFTLKGFFHQEKKTAID